MSFDLSRFNAVLLDLDGTVYHEHHPLPGAAELIRKLQAEQRRFACLSNSADSPQRVAERLATMSIWLSPDAIYTAAAATCDYVLETFVFPDRKPRAFELSTESVHEMLDPHVEWVKSIDQPCDVVVCGAPSNKYASEDRRRIALELLRHGAALVGLCADRVYPSPRGIEFGSGSQTTMLAYAANVTPVFCGKPERIFFMELCHQLKLDPTKCVLIGDNLESDVSGAKPLGMTTILTLSGVTRRRDLEAAPASLQPDHVIEDLTDLL